MGKASSSKKVARAAKAGGSLRDRPKLGYPIAVFVIVILGSALVAYARTDRLATIANKEAPVKDKDHWHTAMGFYVCDHFLPNLVDTRINPTTGEQADPDGIHTHGDGVAHVHPFSSKASGKGARLKIFGEQVSVKFGTDSVEVSGTKYTNGYMCGDKPANVYVYRWSDALDETVPAEVFDRDFGEIRFKTDRSAITVAVVPEGTEVPRPESVSQLNQLDDVPNPNDATGAGQSPAGDPSVLDPTGNPLGIDPTQTITVPSTPTGAVDPLTSVPAAGEPTTPSVSTPVSTPDPTPAPTSASTPG